MCVLKGAITDLSFGSYFYQCSAYSKITGLVDWELSGVYPGSWEFVKALTGVNCDTSDWFSYLPTESIGNHSGAWCQDCFVSRIVL